MENLSREKQIEEMAKVIASVPPIDFPIGSRMQGKHIYILNKFAEALYNEDYRKQNEGEWKKRGNEKTCSRCKFIYYSNNDNWNYCPNCGAKMKGGE